MTDPQALPWPIEDADTAEFWSRVRDGELALQQCKQCGRHQFYPRALCTACGYDELVWVRASGDGIVYSYTIARRAAHPAFASRVPYVVALIDLEEGPRMLSNIVDVDPDEVRIGDRVTVRFDPVDDGVILPMFIPSPPIPADLQTPSDLENR